METRVPLNYMKALNSSLIKNINILSFFCLQVSTPCRFQQGKIWGRKQILGSMSDILTWKRKCGTYVACQQCQCIDSFSEVRIKFQKVQKIWKLVDFEVTECSLCTKQHAKQSIFTVSSNAPHNDLQAGVIRITFTEKDTEAYRSKVRY